MGRCQDRFVTFRGSRKSEPSVRWHTPRGLTRVSSLSTRLVCDFVAGASESPRRVCDADWGHVCITSVRLKDAPLGVAKQDIMEKVKIAELTLERKTEDFQDRQARAYTFADYIMEYPSLQIPVDKYVELIPTIKQRVPCVASVPTGGLATRTALDDTGICS